MSNIKTPRQIANKIVSDVAEHHGVTLEDIKSARGSLETARARQEAYVALLELLGWSTTKVGRFFDKDHSTVVVGRQSVQGRDTLWLDAFISSKSVSSEAASHDR